MDAEKFGTEKVKLLWLAGDVEKADFFFEQCKRLLCEIALGLISIDEGIKQEAQQQRDAVREIMGIQVKFLADERQRAMIEDFENIAGELPMVET